MTQTLLPVTAPASLQAVNFGPPAWLPYGYQVVQKYRAAHKAPTLSHDSLLAALACAPEHWPKPELKVGALWVGELS